jgi:HEAT repeat protein
MSRVALGLVAAVTIGLLNLRGEDTASAFEPPEAERAEAVEKWVKSLDEADEHVRRQAIHELRLLARRVDKTGGKRTQNGGEFEPKMKGLVPVLIKAAKDKAEGNRTLALYALADTLEPAAVATIRERLKDESESVRFNAACLLTEFQDVSGLPELKKALNRLREKPDWSSSFDTERLLASFERATGKQFGAISMNPLLSSDSRAAEAATKRYKELLDTWAAWWNWVPPEK